MNTMGSRYENNFDFLRFFAASLVILSHSYPLLRGSDETEPFQVLTGNMTFGLLAIAIFFMMSGYLISTSWNNEPSLIRFFWKRCLRIYPGIILTTLFSLLIIGPLNTSLSFAEYFGNISLIKYASSIVLFRQDPLPGVFLNTPFPVAVNGSLWSVFLEFTMYVLVALIGLIGLLKKREAIIVLLILEVLLLYRYTEFTGIAQCVVYFMIGVLYNVYQDRIKYNYKIIFVLLPFWIITFKTELYPFISFIFISYLMFYTAFLPVRSLHRFGKHGDFSYGLYIFAFPIQQTIVNLWPGNLNTHEFFILSMGLTLPMAILSWKLVESRALKMKPVASTRFTNPAKIVKK